MAVPLAEPTDLATRTGRSATDPQLLQALQRVSDRFRGAVGYPVTRVTGDVVVLDGDGSTTLLLPAAPVAAVTQVLVDGVAVTDWELASDGRLRRWSGWPRRYGAVSVTYTHGYTVVPKDVADAVLEAAEAALTGQPGVQAMAVGGESVTYARPGVTETWSAAVDRYRVGRDRP